MKISNVAEQAVRHQSYRADGSSNSAAQLLIPEAPPRSFLLLANNSDSEMWFEIGGARATCSLTSGKVTGFSITNAGFGYTIPPIVEFLGGGAGGNSTFLGIGGPGGPAPTAFNSGRPARARAVLTAGAVTSFVIEDPGAGYVCAPYVKLINDANDPNGCADPSASSGSGIPLFPGQRQIWNGTTCPTEAVAVYCASSSKLYTVMWMT